MKITTIQTSNFLGARAVDVNTHLRRIDAAAEKLGAPYGA